MTTPQPVPLRRILAETADRALSYLDRIDDRPVFPRAFDADALGGTISEKPTDPVEVIALLDEAGSAGTVATAGGRYFGFVTGGTLPVALGAAWLASAWDQNAGLWVMSPVAAHLEQTAIRWIADLLGLPAGTGGAFVTGATMGNFAGLAAARHAVMSRAGWDVEEEGLIGAPPVKVVVGDEVHVSVTKALAMLGLGRGTVIRVPVDGQGRMRPDALPRLDSSTILCLQAGNVNTGASDPFGPLVAAGRDAGAWVHVDGAFGLWSAVSPRLADQTAGVDGADSWCVDGHKWLNVPYDSGMVLVRDPTDLAAAMTASAEYLAAPDGRQGMNLAPESSRRARGVEVWAVLRSLGRRGVADLVDRCCRHARRFAEGLSAAGYEVLNEVVLNQVLAAFGDDPATDRVIDGVQADGTCWCGGTRWQGRRAMRISVSSWRTDDEDVERSIDAIVRVARGR